MVLISGSTSNVFNNENPSSINELYIISIMSVLLLTMWISIGFTVGSAL